MTEKKFEVPPAKLTPEDEIFLDGRNIPPIQRNLIKQQMGLDQFANANQTGKNMSAAETFSDLMAKQTEQEIEERSKH